MKSNGLHLPMQRSIENNKINSRKAQKTDDSQGTKQESHVKDLKEDTDSASDFDDGELDQSQKNEVPEHM